MWYKKISNIMKRASENGEISHVGLLTYLDEGCPITLPHHFQLYENHIYFSSLPKSKHTLYFMKSPKISLTLYYSSLHQTTILLKGRPKLVKKKSVTYTYGKNILSNDLFEFEIESIDVSELDPNSRSEQGIIRRIERIYPTKSGKREILLNNDLDDIEEYLRKKNFTPSLLN